VIVIDKMKFGPVPASIHAGDKIVWVNKDLFRHTATSKPGGFDLDLAPGARAAVVVRKAGAFPVTCRYHPGMRAMLKVIR
jgi:plastocyanin